MRTATDVIRRGFDSAVANWPLLLIRIAESIVFAIIAVGAVIAILVPLFVSIGLTASTIGSIDDPSEILTTLLPKYWIVLVYVIVAVTLLLIVFVAMHAFVQGGVARVFSDAERAAGPAAVDRSRLRSFSIDRWLAGGRELWWTLFLIYNIAWGLAGLVMLVPPVAVLAMILLLRESPAAVAIGCIGLAICGFVILIVAVATSLWTQKAIAVAALRSAGAAEALSGAWREAFADFMRHFAVAFVMLVVMIGGSGAISSFSLVFAIPDSAAATLALTPVRLVLSLVNSIFSAAVGNWFLASFVALTAEARK